MNRKYSHLYWVLAAAVAAMLLAVPYLVTDPYVMHIVIMTGVYMMLAASVDIIYGYAGQLNLGQAAFYAIGAYTAALLMLRLHVSYWVAMPAAGIAAAAFGILLGVPTLRLRGLYLGIATMGFSEIVRLTLLTWQKLTRGPMGLPGIPSPTIGSFSIETKTAYYYLILAYLVITIFCVRRLVNSRVGKAWVAIREDEIAASAMGIDTARFKVMAFSLGAFFAGIAGSFFAVYISFISPDSFKMMESYLIFAMPAIGGMGTTAGPLLGALIIYVLPEVTRAFAEYRMLWVGALLALVMIVNPKGIVGGLGSVVERYRHRNAAPEKGGDAGYASS
ncbi:MAG TPA: branched-chain amino acid ABC transporter permease [Firmicutes bacterium]|nr:branched-chain amino acid ABC transporter permease [Bacillota bacterium]